MKKYQSVLVGIAMVLGGATVGTLAGAVVGAVVEIVARVGNPQRPMVPIEQSSAYMDKCMEMGGWHASSRYIGADRIQHMCYGVVDGREVQLDVTYLTELPS